MANQMRRAVILVHFDRRRTLASFVMEALRQYREVADKVVLVSTSLQELPDKLRRSTILDHFIPRENIGYDFCSWKAALDSIKGIRDFDEVIFSNDSVYGPLWSLKEILTDPRTRDADFWGMAKCDLHTPHVQSWFFAARSSLIRSDPFERFWRQVRPLPTKEETIHNYEIGMTTYFRMCGMKIAALFDAASTPPPTWTERLRHVSWRWPARSLKHVRKTRPHRGPFNHSELLWDRLWDAGVPYIKSGIFRHDHYRLSHRVVMRSVEKRFPNWLPLIREHLREFGISI